MKNHKKILIICFSFFLFPALQAQEICDNSIDDDGDGFVDCYDSDCSTNSVCENFYFGEEVTCTETPTADPTFAIKTQWASDDQTAFSSTDLAIGDLDRDGTPDVVVTNRQNKTLTILDGATGRTKHGPLDVGFDVAKSVAIANVDDSDCGFIFVGGYSNNNLKAYDCDLNEIWAVNTRGSQVNVISLADFNGDGVVELLQGNEIRNAVTGDLLLEGTGNFKTDVVYATMAIDILDDGDCTDCSGLEIVGSGKIYSVNTASGTWTKTMVKDINDVPSMNTQEYAIKRIWSWNLNSVSTADYNLDGKIDVLLSGGQKNGATVVTTVFFWDVANNTVIPYQTPNNHDHGTGRINIADIDNDRKLNCTFVSGKKMYALKEDMTLLWEKDIQQGTAGFTGCSVFDFNGDGAAEVVYRGQEFLQIIDGKTGDTQNKIRCTSRTFDEYPVIADVDGDGASEICIACATDNNTSLEPYANGKYAQIRVFEAGNGEHWQPSRRVWNQHAYFNVNINDNLTVPKQQQNPAKVFSTNICTIGPNRPLNVFLNQASYLNETGCPTFASPDIKLDVASIVAQESKCPETNFNVSFDIINSGDIAVTGQLPITFYDGAPQNTTSVKLNTTFVNIATFGVGDIFSITANVIGPGGNFNLYISVNDNGSKSPPIATIPSTVAECDLNNNGASVSVTAEKFDVSFRIESQNINCQAGYPFNGDVSVFYDGTIAEHVTKIWNENFDDLANGDTSDTGTTAWSFTTRPSDADRLEVSFTGSTNEVIFADVDGEAVWESQEINIIGQPEVHIAMNIRSSNQNDAGDYLRVAYVVDGGAETVLTDGNQTGHFGQTTATAVRITGSTLKLIVRGSNSDNDEFYYIDNVLVSGVTPTVSGEITSGFNFYWFNAHNPSDAIYVGNRYTSLGSLNTNTQYIVRAASTTNSCQSTDATFSIQRVQKLPKIVITSKVDISDCATPDGELRAAVEVDGANVTTGYDFKWTIVGDRETILRIGPNALGLKALHYSVEVTNQQSGCLARKSDSDLVVQTNFPAITYALESITHITSCTNTTAGDITITTGEPVDNYSFHWYNGKNVKTVVDYTAAGAIGATYSGKSTGFYTVQVEQNDNRCLSSPLTVEVEDRSASKPIEILILQKNLSCGAIGDGSFQVTSQGNTDGFTFEFFKGLNTLPANKIITVSGPQNSIANFLKASDYSIKVTETATGCIKFGTTKIEDDIKAIITEPTKIIITKETKCGGIPATDGVIDATKVVTLTVGETIDADGKIFGINSSSNGGFEKPIVGSYSQLPMSSVLGWATTATDKRIELWGSGFQGVPAYEGNQFAEINATQQAALYFDLVTKPGVVMSWKFAHRARSTDSKETIALEIGAAGGALTRIGEYSTTNAWELYSGEYTIPAGQTITRFQYQSVVPAGSLGNFLDAIEFVVVPYIFELYKGSNSTGTVFRSSAIPYFDGLAAGTYTLKVKNNLTGCIAPDAVYTITEEINSPTITVGSKTANTYCMGGNGTQSIKIKSAIGEPANGYEAKAYKGSTTAGTAAQTMSLTAAEGATGITITGLEAGPYRIQVKNLDNNCKDYKDVVIDDATKLLTWASPSTTPQSACDPTLTPTGFVAARVTGFLATPAKGFTWEWRDSAGSILATIDGDTDPTANTRSGLAADDYSVIATNNLSNCKTPELTINVASQPANPNITIVQTSAQTACTPANGALRAYVINLDSNPGGEELAESNEYTFQWFQGNDASGIVLVAGTNAGNGSLVNFPDGATIFSKIAGLAAPLGQANYTVKVSRTTTGCDNTKTITLEEKRILPVVTSVNTTADTGCNATSATGTATPVATYDGTAIVTFTGYTIIVYTDVEGMIPYTNTASPLNINAATGVVTGIEVGTYTIRLQNNTTGCLSDVQPFTIAPNPIGPNVVITTDEENTVCSITTPPPTTYNGKISASIDGGVALAGYSYTWHQGQNTVTPVLTAIANSSIGSSTATKAILSNVPDGIYTLEITSVASACTTVKEFTLGSNLTNPIVYNALATDITVGAVGHCVGGTAYPNGKITLNKIKTGNNISTYIYKWYNGGSTTTAPLADGDNILALKGGTPTASIIAGATTHEISNLDQGQYTVVATDQSTGCESSPVTVTVGNKPPTPATADMVGNTVCDLAKATPAEYTGKITLSTGATGYTYAWYQGGAVDTNKEIPADVVPTADNITTNGVLDQIPTGTYTVVITETVANCTNTQSFTVEDNISTTDPKIDISKVTTTANSVCSGATTYPNGVVNVSAVDALPSTSTSYTYTFYKGASVDASEVITAGAAMTGGTALVGITNTGVMSNVLPGQYTVVATLNATGCESDPVTVTVGDATTLPTATIVSTTTNNNGICDRTKAVSLDYNGKITVMPGAGAVGEYTWEWFQGSNDNTINVIATKVPTAMAVNNVLSEIPGGNYTVRITNTTSKCVALHSFSIQDVPTDVVIQAGNDIVATPNTACAGAIVYPNGGLSLNAITGSGNYTFEWYYGTGINTAKKLVDGTNILAQKGGTAGTEEVSGITTSAVVNLDAGTYTVRLTDTNTGCVSNIVTVDVVNDLPTISTAGIKVIQDDYTCNATPTGRIAANITTYSGGPVVGNTGFTIEWFAGTNTLASNLLPNKIAGATAIVDGAGNSHIISPIPQGTYTAKIRHGASQCFATKQITLKKSIPIVSVVVAEVAPQTNCTPLDGKASSTSSILYSNGTPTGLTPSYTYQWYDGSDDTTPLAGQIATTLDAVEAGAYSLIVTETNSGCFFDIATVNIQDKITENKPTLTTEPTVFTTVPSSCDGANGELDVEIITNPKAHPFSFEWYRGSDDFATTPGTPITNGTYASLTFDTPVPNGTTPTTVAYQGLTGGAFAVGNEITGATSGVEITILAVDATNQQLTLDPTTIAGDFAFLFNEEIEDGTSGARAKITEFNSGAFRVGEMITSPAPGSGSAKITAIDFWKNELRLSEVTGDFTTGQVITGPSGTSEVSTDGFTQFTTTINSVAGLTGTTSLTNIESGLYTVVAVDATTGCRYQTTYDLPFLGQQATTTVTVRHVTECPDNGSAFIGLADKFVVEYDNLVGTFAKNEIIEDSRFAQARISSDRVAGVLELSWVAGNLTDMDLFKLGETITGMTSGATANITKITERLYIADAVDDISQYDIYLYAGNGVPADPFASYTVDGNTYPKTISGVGINPGISVRFSSLPAGDYTAMAREIANPAFNPLSTNRCWSAAALGEIEQQAYAPLIETTTLVHNTVCDVATYAGDGSIAVTAKKTPLDIVQIGDFEFRWYEGSGTGGMLLKTDNSILMSTLPSKKPGDYTLVIERQDATSLNGCKIEKEYTILHNPAVHTISDGTVVHLEDCGVTDGYITINDGDITNTTGEYTYNWYTPTVNAGNVIAGAVTHTITQNVGTYFAKATHDQGTSPTGCVTSEFEYNILDNTTDPVIDVTLGNIDTSCDTRVNAGNGVINFSIASATTGSYTYQWYTGATATVGNEVLVADGVTGVAGTFDGTVGGLELTPYTGKLSNIDGGQYTIKITDATTPDLTCDTETTFDLMEDLSIISITPAQFMNTPYTSCTANGAFEIKNVLEDGVAKGLANYTFAWAKKGGGVPGGATSSTLGGTANKLGGLSPRDYQVTITNSVTTCSSVIFFTIQDNTALPNVQFTIVENDSYCTVGGLNGSGELTVGVLNVAGSVVTDGYSYTWYRGVGTGTPLMGGTAVQLKAYRLTGLSDGIYTVIVKDTDASDGSLACEVTAQVVVPQTNPVISIPLTSVTIKSVDNCTVGNGGITVNDVTVDNQTLASQGKDLSDYNFTWTAVAGTGADLSTVSYSSIKNGMNNGIVAITAGTYKVSAANTVTGCNINDVQIVVEDKSQQPNVVFQQLTPDTYCRTVANTNIGAGSLKAEVQESLGVLLTSGYTFAWYRGTTLNDVNNINLGTGANVGSAKIVAGTNNSRIEDLSVGVYTVVVVDTTDPNNSCQTTSSFEVTADLEAISIATTDYSFEPNTKCTNIFYPYDGSIQINAVRLDGAIDNISNYTFIWDAISGGASLTGTTLSSVGGGTDNKRSNFRSGVYTVNVKNTEKDCTLGTPIVITIEDKIVNPAIKFDITPNTQCAGTANGVLKATATVVGVTNNHGDARFTFAWEDSGNNPVTADPVAQDFMSSISELNSTSPTNVFALTVTDQVTGCITTASATVAERLDIPAWNSEFTIVNNSTCDTAAPVGSITVSESSLPGNDLTKFTLQLSKENTPNGTLSNVGTPVVGTTPSYTFASLTHSKYYVEATHIDTKCVATLQQGIVEDTSVQPQITITDIQPDFNCGGIGLDTGSITISADGGVDTYQWYSGTVVAGGNIITGATTNTLSNMSSDTYTIAVSNTTTTCSRSLTIEIPKKEIVPSVSASSTTEQTICKGNGSATVTEMSFNGTLASLGEFTYSWSKPDGTAIASDAGNGNKISNQFAGKYYVVATDKTTGCMSAIATELIIADSTKYPVVRLSSEVGDDQGCTISTKTGKISVTADGFNDTNPTYSFEWFDETVAVVAGGGFQTGSTITGLSAGTYQLLVTDTTTGCSITTKYTVKSIPVDVEITTVEIMPMVKCSPADGSLKVTGISLDMIGDYIFKFYKGNYPGGIVQTSASHELKAQTNGTYYVVATHTATGCDSPVYQYEIEDKRITPVVKQTEIILQTSCNASSPNGTMSVTVIANGISDTTGYDFEWYKGSTTNSIGSKPKVTSLATGLYLVEVTDTTTKCTTQEVFKMADDLDQPINIVTSSTPNVVCGDGVSLPYTGQIVVSLINPNSNVKYEYYYQAGTTSFTPSASNKATSNVISGLKGGDYMVYVRSSLECTSEFEPRKVDEATVTPIFSMTLLQPLTNCDISKPNAEATIDLNSINGEVSDYDFYWHTGAIDGPVVDSAIIVTGLTNVTYFVEMKNKYTACATDNTIVIPTNFPTIPTPEVKVVNRTDCKNNNGSLTASLNTDTLVYTFNWYKGKTLKSTGLSLVGLDTADTYLIETIDLQSGCKSEQVSHTVESSLQVPKFTVSSTSSTCLKPIGEADITMDASSADIKTIEWNKIEADNSKTPVGTDLRLSDATPGNYTVKVKDSNNCEAWLETPFRIDSDIVVYNGVSANGDGKNDFFHIDCSGHFKDNFIRIYSRSGTLVYEMDYYNTEDAERRFDGTSNTGWLAGNTNLPAGTYFYVFNDGTGKEGGIYNGYLELVK